MDKETLEVAAHIGEVLTGLTLVVLILAYLHDRKRQGVQAFLYLHHYLTRDEFTASRHWMRTELPKKTAEERTDATKWGEEGRKHANNVCASYDQAGILLKKGIIAPRWANVFMNSSWSESVHHQHDMLVPYLNTYVAERGGRKVTGHEFFKHFGELSKEVNRHPREGS